MMARSKVAFSLEVAGLLIRASRSELKNVMIHETVSAERDHLEEQTRSFQDGPASENTHELVSGEKSLRLCLHGFCPYRGFVPR